MGGIASLIEDNVSGILVPANDPYYLAAQIVKIVEDKSESIRLGSKGREVAQVRHNPDVVLNKLIDIYSCIYNSADINRE